MLTTSSDCATAGCVAASSAAACEAGATALSLSDATAQSGSDGSYPSGCSFLDSFASLYFNTNQGSSASCSASWPCVCDCGIACSGADVAPTNGAQVRCSVCVSGCPPLHDANACTVPPAHRRNAITEHRIAQGTCTTSTLASGSSCQPTCNAGYYAQDATTCDGGTLSLATCLEATGVPTQSCSGPGSRACVLYMGSAVHGCDGCAEPHIQGLHG